MATHTTSAVSHSARSSKDRCVPLFASVVECPARNPHHVCVRVPIPGFFRVCPVGHTQLPTTSTAFRRFIKGCLPL